jgi:hypothetical protein
MSVEMRSEIIVKKRRVRVVEIEERCMMSECVSVCGREIERE